MRTGLTHQKLSNGLPLLGAGVGAAFWGMLGIAGAGLVGDGGKVGAPPMSTKGSE